MLCQCFILSSYIVGLSINGANICKICMVCYPFPSFFRKMPEKRWECICRMFLCGCYLHHVQHSLIHIETDVVPGKSHAVDALCVVMVGRTRILL